MVYCNCEVAVKNSVNVEWGKPHQNSVNVENMERPAPVIVNVVISR